MAMIPVNPETDFQMSQPNMIENTDTDQIERLNSRIAELLRERDALRKGIQDYLDGNYENPRTYRNKSDGNGKCLHRRWWYEGCDECIDDHFIRLLGAPAPHPIEKIDPS